MKPSRAASLLLLLLPALPAPDARLLAATNVFEDRFEGRIADGWRWVREDRAAWRVRSQALEVRLQPGNMWGGENNARNVLVRPAPNPAAGPVTVTATVENTPREQYEQVDLVWYYDDSHMVKCGLELVDGKLCIVMGREEADRTRTIAIIPIRFFKVSLRLLVDGNRIRGQFRTPESDTWQTAGECDLPVKGAPHISLQFYQGPSTEERWACVTHFRVEQASP